MEAVTDIRDTRVLIPRLRRALDGPTALSSASPSATLSDEQLNAIAADAIGSMIFYSQSVFGATLEVAARDPIYMAPVAWRTDPALDEPRITAVVSQAALDYFFARLSSTAAGKTVETLKDEATEWSWEISPQAVVERLRQLRADRDKALEVLLEAGWESDASWSSFIATRDRWTSVLIEPWVEGPGIGGLNDGLFEGVAILP
jgi:hypothetical protein